MKITVITVCYNSEKTIQETIESVLSQDYGDVEYLIIDGASTDSTKYILAHYSSESTVRFISEPDEGMWDAMNKGAALAKGEYVCFLNSDDCFASHSILSDLAAKLRNEKLDAVFGYIDIVDSNNSDIVVRKYRVSRLSRKLLRMGIMPAHPGFICKACFFQRFGGFKLDSKIAPDFELMVRFYLQGHLKAGLLPKVIVKMKDGGLSNTNLAYILGRFRRQVYSCKINGLWTSSFLVLAKYPYKLLEFFR